MGFLKCALYLSTIGVLSFFLGRILPKKWIRGDSFPFRTYDIEDRFYRFVRVRLWQNKLPDMSRLFPALMPPKNLSGSYRDRLPVMIRETCVAEITHILLAILGFRCMALWQGAGGVILSLLFCIGNLPFVMIQRYNRPKLIRLAKWTETRRITETAEPEQPVREVQECER